MTILLVHPPIRHHTASDVPWQHWQQRFQRSIEALHLASPESVLILVPIAIAIGLITGGVMAIFRFAIEWPLGQWLGFSHPDHYEGLSPWERFLLAFGGGALLGYGFFRLAAPLRQVGIVHVLERLAKGEGHLPIRNAVVQFVAAILCLVSGQSVGREGPAVHIGAASGSWTGRWMGLNDGQNRVLIGCGVAAAIAAAFDTPVSGVVFAIEVVLLDYSVASFAPIILAAVTAATFVQMLFGSEVSIAAPQVALGQASELLLIALLGALIGLFANGFIQLVTAFQRLTAPLPIGWRFGLVGGVTGLIGAFIPAIMGLGYDTLQQGIDGELTLIAAAVALLAKLLATSFSVGAGLPGGVIGPSLVMGGMAATVLIDLFRLGFAIELAPGLGVVLGMAAMMGSVLNAPLAALTALLEMTANPNIILPGMLAIVSAGLVNQQLLGMPSIFVQLLQLRGMASGRAHAVPFLYRSSVVHVMDRRVAALSPRLSRPQLTEALQAPVNWYVVADRRGGSWVLAAATFKMLWQSEEWCRDGQSDLLEFGRWRPVATVSSRMTLAAALGVMAAEGAELLCVVHHRHGEALGVVTRGAIESYYQQSLPAALPPPKPRETK